MFFNTYKYWFDIFYFSFLVCSSLIVQCEHFEPLIGSASDSIFVCVSSVEMRYCNVSLLSVEWFGFFFCNSVLLRVFKRGFFVLFCFYNAQERNIYDRLNNDISLLLYLFFILKDTLPKSMFLTRNPM